MRATLAREKPTRRNSGLLDLAERVRFPRSYYTVDEGIYL
jgi:hypothetical protein